MDFTGKTAVITGAASGIGYLTALQLSQAGAAVGFLDVNPEAAAQAAEKINAAGGHAYAYGVDIRFYEQIEAAVSDLYEKTGRVDILVNCAGGASIRIFNRSEGFHEMPVDVLDWGIDVNLKGPMYMARAVMGYMIQQKSGVIINIGSVDGQTGTPACVDYSTAKAGVMNGLTKSLALYGAPHGVRVCCVSPGPVLTRAAMAKMETRLGRAAEPQEIVDLILFLASDKGAFITGSNYMIDGGRSVGAMSH